MRLVHETTGEDAKPGDTVISFRNEEAILIAGRPPHRPGSTGRVYVRWADDETATEAEFYPSVFGLAWRD